MKCAKPHEWNSGAAMCVTCPWRSGIFESSETAGSSEVGDARLAPFGVPVVPDVRMITRPVSSGATGCSVGEPAISSSRVGSSTLSESCQAMNRLRRVAASSSSPENSSS